MYLMDMGAILAASKSTILFTDEPTVQFFRSKLWTHIQSGIKSIQSMRDLGATTNVPFRISGATLGDRIIAATQKVRRLTRIPITYATKALLILIHALAAGLYGSEVAPMDEGVTRAFQTSILDAIIPNTTLWCAAYGFALNSNGQDLDPETQQFARQATRSRQTITKRPLVKDKTTFFYEIYKRAGHPAVDTTADDRKCGRPAPPPGHPRRRCWKSFFCFSNCTHNPFSSSSSHYGMHFQS